MGLGAGLGCRHCGLEPHDPHPAAVVSRHRRGCGVPRDAAVMPVPGSLGGMEAGVVRGGFLTAHIFVSLLVAKRASF